MKLPLAVAVVVTPVTALACAVCAQDRTPHAALFIAGIIAAPYVIAICVVRAIRSAREDEP